MFTSLPSKFESLDSRGDLMIFDNTFGYIFDFYPRPQGIYCAVCLLIRGETGFYSMIGASKTKFVSVFWITGLWVCWFKYYNLGYSLCVISYSESINFLA